MNYLVFNHHLLLFYSIINSISLEEISTDLFIHIELSLLSNIQNTYRICLPYKYTSN